MTPVEIKSLGEHLRELRRRTIWTVLALFVGAGIGYAWHRPLISLLEHPLNLPLYYTAPSGAMEFILKTCLITGVIAALPVGMFNIIRYVEPALSKKRLGRGKIMTIVTTSTALAIAGVAFGYLAVLPISFKFFAGFSGNGVHALISTHEYLSFVTGCFITFALMFQLPLLLLSINTIRRFPPGGLTRYRRHVLIGSLAVALILPFTYDPMSQLLLALPVVVLFELSVLLVWASNRSAYRMNRPIAQPAKPMKPMAAPVRRMEPVAYVEPQSAPQPRQLDRTRLVRLG